MNSLNTIIIEGNVVQEPVLKETSKGSHVCTFSIMALRAYKKDENYEKEVSFFDVDVWGKLADLCMTNLTKGRGVRVVGRLKQNRWVATDGKKQSKIGITAEHVEFRPVFAQKQSTPNTAKESANHNIDSKIVLSAKEALVF